MICAQKRMLTYCLKVSFERKNAPDIQPTTSVNGFILEWNLQLHFPYASKKKKNQKALKIIAVTCYLSEKSLAYLSNWHKSKGLLLVPQNAHRLPLMSYYHSINILRTNSWLTWPLSLIGTWKHNVLGKWK